MSSYSIIGIFIPFLVAIFLSKFDLKKMLLVALCLVVVGLIGFSLSSSYIFLFFCRLISGSGATIIIGIMLDKLNRKKTFLMIGIIIMAVSFVLLNTGLLTLSFWTVSLGIGFSLVPVCIFALLPELVKPENMSMGMAAVTAASNLGITIGPLGFGTLLDATSENFTIGFIMLGVFSLIGVFAVLRIKTKDA